MQAEEWWQIEFNRFGFIRWRHVKLIFVYVQNKPTFIVQRLFETCLTDQYLGLTFICIHCHRWLIAFISAQQCCMFQCIRPSTGINVRPLKRKQNAYIYARRLSYIRKNAALLSIVEYNILWCLKVNTKYNWFILSTRGRISSN